MRSSALGNYRRYDYSPQPGTEQLPIEQAMTLFVDWAKKNDRNYVGDLVKENLMVEIQSGATPQQAVQRFLARTSRR